MLNRKCVSILLLVCAAAVFADVPEVMVTSRNGKTVGIQEALDWCPNSGCVIRLQGGVYELANSLLLRNRKNFRITGGGAVEKVIIRFQDDGSLAGPDHNPDSLAMKPAGWKHWPYHGGSTVGGSKNTTNAFSQKGIYNNGVLQIIGCDSILIDSLTIDGVAPIGWGSIGVWNGQYPTFYGNFGINVSYSSNVDVRFCEIRNCFAGIYIRDVPAKKWMAGYLFDSLSWEKRLKNGGGHQFEWNRLHSNFWAAYNDGNSGKGMVWKNNRIYENHNSSAVFDQWLTAGSPCYDASNWNKTKLFAKLCDNSEAKNHVGGFLFFRDSSVTDTVVNNTFWRNGRIIGSMGWGNVRFVFSNNIVADPWLDYNQDTTGYSTKNFSSRYGDWTDVLISNPRSVMAENFHDNVFSVFPRLCVNECDLKNSMIVWDAKKIDIDSIVTWSGLHWSLLKYSDGSDTIGTILEFDSLQNCAFEGNFFIKSVPLIVDTERNDFLSPIWNDFGVDRAVVGNTWTFNGAAPKAKGAVMKSASSAICQKKENGYYERRMLRHAAGGRLVFPIGTDASDFTVIGENGKVLKSIGIVNGLSAQRLPASGIWIARWKSHDIWLQEIVIAE